MSTTPKLPHPAAELMRRYAGILGAAWAARHELAGPRRLADEVAFLPAALSIQETPPHPAPRRAPWLIMAFVCAALLWGWFGQVDIVAVAPGRLVVSDRTKLVQPLEAGVVRVIHVRNGSRVQAGQVLIELDTTAASAEHQGVEEQLRTVTQDADRASAMLSALEARADPSSPNAAVRPQLRAEWQDFAARAERLDAKIAHRRAEANTVRELITKLQQTLPIVRQRENDFKALGEQGFVSSHAGQDRTRERVEAERDLATQLARLAEAEAALTESRQARSAFEAETRRSLTDRLVKARQDLSLLRPQGAKTAQRQQLMRLTAPVSGTVQQLAVHSPGGVVTPAQNLMVVVPDAAALTAEVAVENQDIGFVHEGQAAQVKLETFSFTRYGTLPARVRTVSADAVVDDKRGAVFAVTLTLDRDAIEVDGRTVRLAPGMNLTAEVRIGRRRVIDYWLGPLQRRTSEALRER